MDWNWFFSSLSQSAAAIVGLFGAFIITKILNNQSTFSEKNIHCKELLNRSRQLIDHVYDFDFELYNFKSTYIEIRHLIDKLSITPHPPAQQFYERLNFSIFIPRLKIINMINNVISDYEGLESRNKINFFSIYSSEFSIPSNLEPNFEGGINLWVIKEQENINNSFRDAKQQIRLISTTLASLKGNPESSPQITYALILVTFLFFIGVILPLYFLPTSQSGSFDISLEAVKLSILSLKGLMLLSISFIFFLILSLFFVQNIKMRYSKKMIEEMESYTHLSTYSKYFKIRTDNESDIESKG